MGAAVLFFEPYHSIDENEFRYSVGDAIDFPPHLHRSFEFFYQISGGTEVTVGGTKYTLEPKDAVLVFPFQVHSYRSVINGRHEMIIFSPDVVMSFSKSRQNLLPLSNKMRCEHIPVNTAANIFQKKACAYEICGTFERGREYRPASESGSHTTLVKLLLYANENFRDSCLLRSASAEIGYDYAYISKFFKRSVGISFRKYVNMLRVRESQYLLKLTSKSIGDIGEECGFGSLRAFDREFCAVAGCTPSDYRKKKFDG